MDMAWFLSPALQPFSIAAAVLIALLLIEIVGLVSGMAISDVAESTSVGEAAENALSWLNLGRVPLLMLLIILLGLFAAGGMVLQAVAEKTVGLLPPLIASLIAGTFALPATRMASRGVARILPREESYALSDQDLVGRVGTVTVGPLDAHKVGKISVTDAHGNRHFPRARPATAGDVIETGAKVLIVDLAGREYRVIRAPAALADGQPNG
jgi:hypothetical protein